MTHETIQQTVQELGRGFAGEAVVVGSSALQLAIPDLRRPHDLNLSVGEDAYRYLHGEPGWREATAPDGATYLYKDRLTVGVGLHGTATHEELKGRSWRTDGGLQVAGLPDMYAYKLRRGMLADAVDTISLRHYLQDPQHAPLSAGRIPHEVAAARACLPEALQDDPDAQAAILLAANGLHIVYTLYGHPGIGQVNQIIGQLERPEFGVPATYHNGFGLLADARRLQQHLENIQAPPRDRLLALAADPYTDAVYGGGRFRDNPNAHDELRSAELVRGHALQLGFGQAEADRMHSGVVNTTFDEVTRSQRGKAAPDPLARALVAVDLQPLAEPDSVENSSTNIAVEDGFSARYSRARTVGRVLVANGERVRSTAEALPLIDRYADHRPVEAPEGPTVMEAYAGRLAENAEFHRSYEPPADWTLDNPALRHAHADKLDELSTRLLAGEISAQEAHRLAAVHTAEWSR